MMTTATPYGINIAMENNERTQHITANTSTHQTKSTPLQQTPNGIKKVGNIIGDSNTSTNAVDGNVTNGNTE